jgi:hypothetical protein
MPVRAATKDRPDDYLPEHVGLQPYITMEILGLAKGGFQRIPASAWVASGNRSGGTRHSFLCGLAWALCGGWFPTIAHHDFTTTGGWGRTPKATPPSTEFMVCSSTYMGPNITAKDFAKVVHSPARRADPLHVTSTTLGNQIGRLKLFIRARRRVASQVRCAETA